MGRTGAEMLEPDERGVCRPRAEVPQPQRQPLHAELQKNISTVIREKKNISVACPAPHIYYLIPSKCGIDRAMRPGRDGGIREGKSCLRDVELVELVLEPGLREPIHLRGRRVLRAKHKYSSVVTHGGRCRGLLRRGTVFLRSTSLAHIIDLYLLRDCRCAEALICVCGRLWPLPHSRSKYLIIINFQMSRSVLGDVVKYVRGQLERAMTLHASPQHALVRPQVIGWPFNVPPGGVPRVPRAGRVHQRAAAAGHGCVAGVGWWGLVTAHRPGVWTAAAGRVVCVCRPVH